MKTVRLGKLIVIEGSDGCGKNTQAKLLVEELNRRKIKSKLVSFPNYDSLSSGPVQMYLNGELGKLDDISFRQASILYAVDRFCTIRSQGIDKLLDEGWYIVCDRYVPSNLIHQAAKYYGKPMTVNLVVDWINNLEYRELKLPEPDIVIFLDVKPEISAKLKESRLKNPDMSKTGIVDRSKDIHESNTDFMTKSYLNGIDIAKKLGWIIIDCNDTSDDQSSIKPIEFIHKDIINTILMNFDNKNM